MIVKVNNKNFKGKEGQTIKEFLEEKGFEIPSLCHHPDLKPGGSCRICLVEVRGKGLVTSCNTKVEKGMEIITNSSKINRARKINLELIFSQHTEECFDCVWRFNCEMLRLAKKYNVEISRFKDRKTGYPVYDFGPSLIFDSSKCIDCRNCIDVCDKQGVKFLKSEEKGHLFHVVPNKNRDCIYCGQCILHCPAGAFEAVGEFEDIEVPFKIKDKFLFVQIAPSIRTSIGEEFGIPSGIDITEKIVSALKKLGANKVFDVSVGSDFTTVEEAKELAERISENKGLPMFTSCCPAWVRFVEKYYPEFKKNLTTVRSPQIISGMLIKRYYSLKKNININDIKVISIMPCVSKKYEVKREELKVDGILPVDYVLTTRELARLLKEKKIDLRKVKPQKMDNPFGSPSGAGIIYGVTGGVMESALRTAYYDLTGKNFKKIEFKEIRGPKGIRAANIKIGKKELKIGVIHGTGNAKIILERMKKGEKIFDYVEVMACPCGCIGGGGQPVPTNSKIRKKRADGLYKIDKNKKTRLAHENPILKEIYKDNPDIISGIFHTTY